MFDCNRNVCIKHELCALSESVNGASSSSMTLELAISKEKRSIKWFSVRYVLFEYIYRINIPIN